MGGREVATAPRSGTAKRPDTAKLTVAEILKRNAAQYIEAYPAQAAPQVQSTLAKLSLCRTAALGGHVYRCGDCQHSVVVHNSCGDRYCPTCSGARRADWLDSAAALIIEGVDHFQVVFTLPSELSRLSLGNRRPVYDLLFASAWSALKKTIDNEQGFDAAALMVLHTWNQKLDAHAHVHAVVPGCGPATDGNGIKFAQRGDDASSRGRYLVDANDLRAAFREAFLRGLTKLWQREELKLTGEFEPLLDADNWQALIADLEKTDGVSFIQPPPPDLSVNQDAANQSATHVLKYLTRYLSGGPISDQRIVSTDHDSVIFLARAGDTSGGNAQQVPVMIPQVEFTRRWSLHILPAGYTRTRRFGGWSNPCRRKYLKFLKQHLPAAETVQPEPADTDPSPDNCEAQVVTSGDDLPAPPTCPHCGTPLIPHRVIAKPSWRDVMASCHRPRWYRRL